MTPQGTLLVVDYVVEPDNAPDFGKFLDLELMVTEGGFQRTEQEFRAPVHGAGFVAKKVRPTPTPLKILEVSRA